MLPAARTSRRSRGSGYDGPPGGTPPLTPEASSTPEGRTVVRPSGVLHNRPHTHVSLTAFSRPHHAEERGRHAGSRIMTRRRALTTSLCGRVQRPASCLVRADSPSGGERSWPCRQDARTGILGEGG